MKVLVIGGTGWVGHNVAIDCQNAGYEVVICSRGIKDDYNENIPKSIPTLQADRNNEQQMIHILRDNYDIIIDTFPEEQAIDHIVKYSPNLKHYLHCSSVMSYAPLPFFPGDETMPFSEYLGYGAQKNIVDTKAINLCQKGKLPATVIRPSYITGSGRFPIDNLGGRREDFIADILNEKPLDLPNDGNALLHPVHAKDVSNSFLLAIQHPESIGQCYNICSDKAVTLKKYLEISAAALNQTIHINFVPLEEMVKKYKDMDEAGFRFFAEHMCYDIAKASTQLEYVPKYSAAAAIEETARWAAKQY